MGWREMQQLQDKIHLQAVGSSLATSIKWGPGSAEVLEGFGD
jgi:hypothetical protein